MNRNMWKTTYREIRGSLGRYLAIFAIIALGVGFFSGLKVTRQAMVDAANRFVSDQNMFDFRLISTIGLTDEDVEYFSGIEGIEKACGSYYADAVTTDGNREYVVRYLSMDNGVNMPSLSAGRLPETSGEILADARYYSAYDIGKTLVIKEAEPKESGTESVSGSDDSVKELINEYLGEGNNDPADSFKTKELTIVGLAYSPLYLNYERGTTSVGNGSISYFCYMLPENFDMAAYTDIYLALNEKEYIFSDEYKELIDSRKTGLEEKLQTQAEDRLNNLITEGLEKYGIPEAQREFVVNMLKSNGMIPESPSTYVLTRNENIGYACFENDSKIVDGIAVVFPVFFFLVAALVCITTMSRMIEEQRTQIGVLKALGYGEGSIISKYMIYSGSAAIIGCIGGFFLGCYVFPAVIWKVYGLMYGFTEISFVFNATLFIISIAVSLLCSVGTTYIACKTDLHQVSAELIRPKAPKNGKRILLERISFLWKRIPFLHKVSLRNVFRYKGRFVMMLLGISGCTGLLITGFGIRDSITEIADAQYTQILVYDELINFSERLNTEELGEFREQFSDIIETFMPVLQTSVNPVDTGSVRSVNLIALAGEEDWKKVVLLHDKDGKQLDYPGPGEVILSQNVAKVNNCKTGDTIKLRDNDFNEFDLKVSGICENFFNSYAYISKETYLKSVPMDEMTYKSAFVCISEGKDLHEAAAGFSSDSDKVSAVNVNADTLEMFSRMMQTMNYIVILVIACAAALAFIVLYNLTNINITERIREIATIKVLGFYANETAQYVFRENMVLTLLGAILGVPVGIWLHGYVMSNIKIDMVTFDVHINGISYVYSFLFTFAFALFVAFVMYFKLKRVNMAESLKSIE